MKNNHRIIPLLKGEYWYGGHVRRSDLMPYGDRTMFTTMAGDTDGSQASPFLVSNRGRYVWCDGHFDFGIENRTLVIDRIGGGELTVGQGHENLKNAYLDACRAHFPASGTTPDRLNFKVPQYNTWIELSWWPTQEKILAYADKIISAGMPPGIFMVDDFWYMRNGDWRFDGRAFPDPKAMVDSLHEKGFKIILWTSPFVSPDSPVYHELKNRGYLVRSAGEKRPAVRKWWNGFGALLDLANPPAFKWYEEQLKRLVDDYGIDGFKFDAGDAKDWRFDDQVYGNATPNMQSEAFAKVGLSFGTAEYRACWKMGGQSLIQRVRDKAHIWGFNGLADLLPNALCQGLLGYPYTCPDMIGGGEAQQLDLAGKKIDQELFVRWAQCSIFFPIIQFSLLPQNVLDPDNFETVMNLVKFRQETVTPRILELVDHASKTGEPVLRMMEYVFPGSGFESVMDQFMFGDDILVAPVLVKGAVERTVRFPVGRWEGDDGSVIKGPAEVTVQAPVERLPWYRRTD